MRTSKKIFILQMFIFSGLLPSCAILPKTLGESASGFTYVPLDPLPVYIYPDEQTCRFDANYNLNSGYAYKNYLDQFTDISVRLAISSFNAKAGVSFGPSSLGVEGNTYKVVLDYINTDNVPTPFRIRVDVAPDGARTYQVDRLYGEANAAEVRSKTDPSEGIIRAETPINSEFSIPVYVGVGLRLVADIEVIKGSVNLASLGSIAASVEAGNSVGSLTVQTLGVSGEKIVANLPLPSKLNQTTIENAISSVGAIKALIHGEDVNINPRVTGIYLPVGDGSVELTNLITSELAEADIPWVVDCNYTPPS